MARNIAAAGFPLARLEPHPRQGRAARRGRRAGRRLRRRRRPRRRRGGHDAVRRRVRRVRPDRGPRRRWPPAPRWSRSPPSASPARTGWRARRRSSAWCTSTRRSSAPRSRPTTGPWWSSPPARRTSARRSQPVFDAIGSRTVWVGEAGQGTRLKLVANSWVLTVVEGIAESLSLAKALGVEPEKFLDVVKGGAMDAPYVQLKGKAMLRRRLHAVLRPRRRGQGRRPDRRGRPGRRRRPGGPGGRAAALRPRPGAGHGDQDMAATFLEH